MNKSAIKSFAIWARNKLINDISYKAGLLGVTEKEINSPLPQSTKDVQFFDIGTNNPYQITGIAIAQRRQLVDLITEKAKQSDYSTAYKSVIEEVAYTWFNRLIAIRFMEVNEYLPSSIWVLSSVTGKAEPDIVTTPFETNLQFSQSEREYIISCKSDSKLDELFRMLFIKQCNALNELLPELFERIDDYSELLLNISFTDNDGIIWHLVNDIEEEDFKEAVEITGWMYQYYNTEPKDETFALLKKNVKITKERIPAATQLFTPNWIVRYMVENSLGRLWLEGHSNDDLKSTWKYYLDEAEQTPEVQEQLNKIQAERQGQSPEDITFLDPCMGSGHILVYAFDVFMQIYDSAGYNKRDAAQLILKKNIYGLDIDKRAYQLSYFALFMKARQYNRQIFDGNVTPQVYHSGGWLDGEEFGSLIKIENPGKKPEKSEEISLYNADYIKDLRIWNFKQLLSMKCDVVCTNPPYMGSSGMNGRLSQYVKDNYSDFKGDLFATFIERCNSFTKRSGYYAMITQPSLLFLSTFEKTRNIISVQNTISSLLHMGRGIFGIDFGSTAFIIKKQHLFNYIGRFFRLHERTFQYIEPSDIEKLYLYAKDEKLNRYNFQSYTTECGIIIDDELTSGISLSYNSNTNNFTKIPGNPIAYYASDNFFNSFEVGIPIGKVAIARNGLKTGDNDKFVRLWWEVDIGLLCLNAFNVNDAISSNAKWFPYNKGGEFRRWYGNNDYIINWSNGGSNVIGNAKRDGRNVQDYPIELKFTESVSWSLVTSVKPAFRYKANCISDIAGMSLYLCGINIFWLLGFCNTKITTEMLRLMAPTINLQAGDIARLPIIKNEFFNNTINDLVKENIALSRIDWDYFEISWEFKQHPLIKYDLLSTSYTTWKQESNERFYTLKANEEELNHIFINIYGLQDELNPDVEDNDITVRQADLSREIRSLLSYAVGCMFGRYSLDVEGLIYAGGEWDTSKYKSFIPNKDNIIPITDEEYLPNDVVTRIVEFIRTVYGTETLEKNLRFIADALGGKSGTVRDVIRNYFIKDFFNDHIKIYKKRPIYWLFDSGKENGFKALIYLHRYNPDTIGMLRIDYLHKLQRIYENEIERMREAIEKSTDARTVSDAQKRLEKLRKQLKETKDYDEKIAHLALARIDLDLDDGVKVNYEKLQTDADGKKYEVLAKI